MDIRALVLNRLVRLLATLIQRAGGAAYVEPVILISVQTFLPFFQLHILC